MTDEQQIRSLLTLAAEPPDDIEPPVSSLLERGRRERKLRAILSVLSVAVIAAAAFGLPPIVRALAPGQTSPAQPTVPPGLFPAHPGRPGSGPSAAQLSRFRWSALPPSPIGPRSQPVLAWTGKELLELGGVKNGSTASDGAAFDPATGRWRTIASVRANVGFSDAVDVWTGRQLFIANGQNGSCAGGVPVARCLPRAGLYDPATNQWTTTLLPKQLDGLALGAAAWTGRDVVLAGVSAAHAQAQGRRLRPRDQPLAHDHASTARKPPAGRPRHGRHVQPRAAVVPVVEDHEALGDRLLGRVRHRRLVFRPGPAGLLSPATGPSTRPSTAPTSPAAPSCCPPARSGVACAATPASRTRPAWPTPARSGCSPSRPDRSLPTRDSSRRSGSGTALAPWPRTARDQELPRQAGRLGRMAAWDPPSQRWFSLPSAPGRPPMAASPVWAGRELLLLTASGGLLVLPWLTRGRADSDSGQRVPAQAGIICRARPRPAAGLRTAAPQQV